MSALDDGYNKFTRTVFLFKTLWVGMESSFLEYFERVMSRNECYLVIDNIEHRMIKFDKSAEMLFQELSTFRRRVILDLYSRFKRKTVELMILLIEYTRHGRDLGYEFSNLYDGVVIMKSNGKEYQIVWKPTDP